MCGNTDPDTFARCYHPMCPDGHDQPGRFPSYPPAPITPSDRKTGRVILLVILFAIISMIYACTSQIVLRPARAFDHGFDQSTPVSKWFKTVQRPDARPATCCGYGDGYEADVYVNRGDHYDVTITDDSEIMYPDGDHRQPIANGTVINVPITKVNPPSDGNPTGHGVLFITVQDGKMLGVYCYVPLPPSS